MTHAIVPAPRTIFAGVQKPPAATVAVIERDGRRTDTRYRAPALDASEYTGPSSADEWKDALGASLRTAVKRRLVADVPVGVLRSGGVDSRPACRSSITSWSSWPSPVRPS